MLIRVALRSLPNRITPSALSDVQFPLFSYIALYGREFTPPLDVPWGTTGLASGLFVFRRSFTNASLGQHPKVAQLPVKPFHQ
jgi:hypothetical protein